MDASPARPLRSTIAILCLLGLGLAVAFAAAPLSAHAAAAKGHHRTLKKAGKRGHTQKLNRRRPPARTGAAETGGSLPSSTANGIGNNQSTGSEAPSAPVEGRRPTQPTTPVTPTTPTAPTVPTKPSSPSSPTPPTTTPPTTTPEAPHETPQEAPPTSTPVGGSGAGPMTMAPAVMSSGFEEGLLGWNTAGSGEVIPTTESSIVRSGSSAARFVLTGTQNRSELGFGGTGTAAPTGKNFYEGEEYWYGFSFYIGQMVWGHPGSQNLIMQFKSEGEGSPNFGLQLWNWGGERNNGGCGLWSEGEAMKIGNEEHRFLAPITEHTWHEVQIHFKASSVGAGFYELFLDGRLLESRQGVSMILPGKRSAYIKGGLYRNGAVASGTSELLLDDVSLGTSQASVTPR
jgi:hypothetical protein